MPVGKISFSCKRLHTGLPSASVRNIFNFVSLFRFSLKDSKAICCFAQNVTADF